jgi:hypothetical protein
VNNSKILIIGSVALSYHIEPKTYPKDYDFMCSYENFANLVKDNLALISCYPKSGNKMILVEREQIAECEIAWEGSLAEELINLTSKDPDSIPIEGNFIVPSLDVLYMIKMSHRFLRNSPHFNKTREHIKLMRENGAVIPAGYRDWYNRRVKETYNYSHPNLDVKAKDFFKDTESYNRYDHDTIHEAIKLSAEPAYRMFLADDAQVKCDEKKFNAMQHVCKINAVLEEAYTLALERSQIPNDLNVAPITSFKIALEKICTSITSGWFREFAWENYDEIMRNFSGDYVNQFNEALQNGSILPFKNNI